MNKEKVKRICIICNREFLVIPSEKNRKFCSVKCSAQFKKISYLAENNPMWKGGTKTAYCHRIARQNLVQKCINCLTLKRLEIHHIDFNNKNNKLSNLVILCKSCHSKIHNRVKNITKNQESII